MSWSGFYCEPDFEREKKRFKIGIAILAVVFLALVVSSAFGATTDFDKRDRGIAPVAVDKVTVTIDISAHTTVGSTTITDNGKLEMVIIDAPDLEASHTLTVDLKTPEGADIYTKSSISENTQTVDRPSSDTLLVGTTTVEVTSSGAEVSDQDIDIYLYYR